MTNTPVFTHAGRTIPSLDGIRAVAIIMVFFAHSGLENTVPGGLGVTIFFVLSGYLITTLMRIEYEKSGGFHYRGFYLRRALRLMPPLLIIVAATVLLSATGVIDGGYSFSGLMSVLFYFGNYHMIVTNYDGIPAGLSVIWSLAIEEQYYLLFPPLAVLLFRIGRPRISAITLFALCLAVLAWRYGLMLHGASDTYMYRATDTRVDSILAGCLLAVLKNPWLDGPATSRNYTRDWLVISACIAVLLFTLLYRDEFFRQTLRYTLQNFAIVPLIYLAVARADRFPFSWLNTRVMVYIGSISYTIYLTHLTVIYAITKYWPQLDWIWLMLGTAVLTLAVAEPMRRWVEEPCARLRKHLHQKYLSEKTSADKLVVETS